MNYRALLILGVSLGLAAPAVAKSAPVTITVVGETSAKILVNGKEYIPGTPLPRGAKVSVSGPATIKIGGSIIKTDGSAELKVSGTSLTVVSGSVAVTGANGQTTTLAAGQSAKVSTPAAAASAAPAESAPVASSVLPLSPPPSPTQNTAAAPVSPSSP